jgi:hypothetical protein
MPMNWKYPGGTLARGITICSPGAGRYPSIESRSRGLLAGDVSGTKSEYVTPATPGTASMRSRSTRQKVHCSSAL